LSLWFLEFAPGVQLSTGTDRELALFHPDRGGVGLRQLGKGTVAALGRLSPPGEEVDRLAQTILATDGWQALSRWLSCVNHLGRYGLVHFSVRAEDKLLGTLVPIVASFTFAPLTPCPESRYVLSHFAFLRNLDGRLVIESPMSSGRVVLHEGQGAVLVHRLAQPCRIADLDAGPTTAPNALLALLLTAGMVQPVNADGTMAGDTAALRCWDFHDLLFHTRSRKGRHNEVVGAAYRWVHEMEPPSALKPPMADAIDLFRPDLDELQRNDQPLARVQQERRSIREYATEPIDARRLGEFLYRVGRLREYWEGDIETPKGTVRMDFASRPYPAGGGLYELEIYPVVQSCRGLAVGLYHYDPRFHRLEVISRRTAEVEQLWKDAAAAAGVAADSLQVLLIVAARFGRVAWKYSSLAYALVLKHVGVLYMNMYLSATAMGLAPCALGAGDSDRFARAAGLDFYTETSVGEFLLGSKQ
jgi:oxazoline/thiazoline dehydrogenase